MKPFDHDQRHHLDQLYNRLDYFLIPLATQQDSTVAVLARVACRFGCRIELDIVPSEWHNYRTASTTHIDTALPSTDHSGRHFLTTGYCPSCTTAMDPSR